MKDNNYIVWDEYFMGVAILSSMRSKDPSTKVGACIVNQDKKIVGIGYLCEIAASICQEAGAKSVADMVILGGKIIIMVLAIPIIQALVDVVLGVLP